MSDESDEVGLEEELEAVGATPQELEAILRRTEACTEGPWRARRTGGFIAITSGLPGGFGTVALVETDDNPDAEPEAEFLAHARLDVPRLMAAVTILATRCLKLDKILEEAVDGLDEINKGLINQLETVSAISVARERQLMDALDALEDATRSNPLFYLDGLSFELPGDVRAKVDAARQGAPTCGGVPPPPRPPGMVEDPEPKVVSGLG